MLKVSLKLLCLLLAGWLIVQPMLSVYAQQSHPPEDGEIITEFMPLGNEVEQEIELNSGVLPTLPNVIKAKVTRTLWTDTSSIAFEPRYEAETQTVITEVAVEWISDKKFTDSANDSFVYTAQPADKNTTVADGVELPIISITVIGEPLSTESIPENHSLEAEVSWEEVIANTQNSFAGTQWVTVPGIEGGGKVYFNYDTGFITYTTGLITSATIPAEINGVAVVGLGDRAFASTDISSLTIPTSVTSIGVGAFSNCDNLITVSIPSSVTVLEDYLFDGSAKLESVVLHEQITELGNYVFRHCIALKTITLPNSVKNLGNSVFYGCTALTTASMGNGVTDIGGSTFEKCSSLTSVTLSDKLTILPGYTFKGCTALKSLDIPTSVDTIGPDIFDNCGVTHLAVTPNMKSFSNYAFRNSLLETVVYEEGSLNNMGGLFVNSKRLKTVTLHEGLIEIPSNAFEGCSALTTINIPSTVTRIGTSAFGDCTMLTRLTIPSSVYYIRTNAFENTGFTTAGPIDGEYGLEFGWDTKIPGNAFMGMSELVSVELPNTLSDIGLSAFKNCTSLLTATIPGGVTNNTTGSMFEGCSSLQSVVLSEGVTTVSSAMFKDCSSLQSVSIPSTVDYIGEEAFLNCGELEQVVIPEKVITSSTLSSKIAEDAFKNCSLLTTAGPVGGDYDIRFTVTTAIPIDMFHGANKLTSVTFPNSITTIGRSAFEDTPALTQITLPSSLTTIDNSAFKSSGLTSVVLPDSVTTIGVSVFENTHALKQVTFPSNLTTIGNSAFKSSGLTSVALPDSVTTIGSSVFENTHALKQVTFPSNLTSIGNSAFLSSGITSVTLPDSMRKIDYSAFSKSTSLESVTLNDGLETIGGNNVFNGCTALTSIDIPDTVTKMGDDTFLGCSSLSSATLSTGMDTIFDGTFRDSGLTSITIPDNYTKIERDAFYDCAKLETVNFSDNITYIGDDAFGKCTTLTNLILPRSLTTLESGAFSYCSSIARVIIPSGVTTFNDSFQFCSALSYLELPNGLLTINGGHVIRGAAITELFIPASVHTINNITAFSTSYLAAGFKLIVVPQSRGEEFAISMRIPYEYFSSGAPTISLTLPSGDYNGMTIRITDKVSNEAKSIKGDGANIYRISGIKENTSYKIELINRFGDVIGSVDNVDVVSGNNPVTMSIDNNTHTVSLNVTVAGADVTEQLEINWYTKLNNQAVHVATAPSVNNLTTGRELAYEVVLNAELAKEYQTPATGTHTVTSTGNEIDISLVRIPDITITGRVVSADGAPINGATVSIAQNIGGENVTTSSTTGANGTFFLSTKNVPGKLIVSKLEFINHEINNDSWASNDLGDITLSEITGAVVNLSVLKTDNVELDTEAIPTAVSTSNGLEISLYNVTKNREITNVSVQYPSIVVLDNSVTEGDSIRATVADTEGDYANGIATATLTANLADVEVNLLQNGRARLKASSAENSSTVAMVYNTAGNLVGVYPYQGLITLTDPLPNASYTVISMGESTGYNNIQKLSDLQNAGLVEGVDYAKNSFEAVAGTLKNVSISHIPMFDEEKFYYTDPNHSSFRANFSEVMIGKTVAYRTDITFKEEYADRVTGVRFIADLPAELSLLTNVVMVGQESADYTHDSATNTISIPINDLGQTYLFCVEPVDAGEYSVNAMIEFMLDGEKKLQPIGNVSLTVEGFTFNVPTETADTSMYISGIAYPGAQLYVYDNNQLAGELSVNKYGEVFGQIELIKRYESENHTIHIEGSYGSGTIYRSSEYITHYDKNHVEVAKVTLLTGASEIDLDFNNAENSETVYVSKGAGKPITVIAEFTDKSKEAVRDVIFHLEGHNDRDDNIAATYDETTGSWIAVTERAIVTNVGVSFQDGVEFEKTQQQYDDENAYVEMIVDGMTSEGNEDPFGYNIISSDDKSITADLYWDDDVYGSDGESLAAMKYTLLDYADYASIDLEAAGFVMSTIGTLTTYTKYSSHDFAVDEYTIVSPTTQDAFHVAIDYTPITEAMQGEIEAKVGSYFSDEEQASSSLDEASALSAQDEINYYGGISSAGPLKWIRYVSNTISGVKKVAPFIDAAVEINAMKNFIDVTLPDINNKREEIIQLANAVCVDGSSRLDNPEQYYNSPLFIETELYHQLQAEDLVEYTQLFSLDKLLRNNDYYAKVMDIYSDISGIVKGEATALQIGKKIIAYGYDLTKVYFKWKGQNMSKELWEPVEDVANIIDGIALGGLSDAYAVTAESSHKQRMRKRYSDYANQLLTIKKQILQDYKECPQGREPSHLPVVAPDNPDAFFPVTLKPIIDPSGYVYEAVPSNRILGVTTTVYEEVTETNIFGDETKHAQLWDAEEYGQQNPLITNEEGRYAWDVPAGNWQVKYELEGYETTYSEWLPVPPPQLEVNIPITSYEQPTVKAVTGYQNGILIEFSKYMELNDLNNSNIIVTKNGIAIEGAVSLVNSEQAADGGSSYASKIEFVPISNLSVGDVVSVKITNSVQSYAAVNMAEEYLNDAVTITTRPEDMTPEVNIVELTHGETVDLKVSLAPASAVSGMNLVTTPALNRIASVAEHSVIDGNGIATVTIMGSLPGTTELNLQLEGTDMQSTVIVNVAEREITQQGSIFGTVESGNNIDMIAVELSNGDSYTITPDSSNAFAFTDLDPGNYTVTIKQKSHITHVVENIVVGQGEYVSITENGVITLTAGDVDGDGDIDIDDLSAIASPENYNLEAFEMNKFDINGDRVVNFNDLATARVNSLTAG